MKYTKEMLQDAVDNSISYAGVLRHFGLKMSGGTQAHIKRRMQHFKIDTDHFKGQRWNSGNISRERKTPEQIFVKLDDGSNKPKRNQLVRALTETGMVYECVKCGNQGVWNNEELVLHVDHIDGDWLNNERCNLRFLCPNCHTQTDTFGSKRLKRDHTCIDCGCGIHRGSKRCMKCGANKRKSGIPQKRKFEVNKDELERLVTLHPMTKIGEMFGVSDNAIRKRCISLNVNFKELRKNR